MRRKAILVLLGLSLGLAASEAVLRIASPSTINRFRLYRHIDSERGKFWQYDALLGWEGIPDTEDEFRWIDCRHRVRQNGLGFRGTEHGFPRAGVRRLLVLGDSFVWGYGVEEEQIFTRLLEARGGAPREVVNLGVSGYGTDQELLLWREQGHRWQPDEVLLVITPYTDLFDIMFDERYGYPKPQFRRDESGALRLVNVPVPRRSPESVTPAEIELGEPSWLYHLTTRSALMSLTVDLLSHRPAVRGFLERQRVTPKRLPGYGFEYPLFQASPESRIEESWRLLSELVATLGREVRESGAELIVAVAPSSIQVYPELWDEFLEGSPPAATGLDPEEPGRRIAAMGRARGVRVIDLLPALREAAPAHRPLYFPINSHWTAEGHRVVAEALAAALGAGETS